MSSRKIAHDVKNATVHTIEELREMNDLPYDDRLRILVAYNAMIISYLALIDQL